MAVDGFNSIFIAAADTFNSDSAMNLGVTIFLRFNIFDLA